jgi:hypothetical protein
MTTNTKVGLAGGLFVAIVVMLVMWALTPKPAPHQVTKMSTPTPVAAVELPPAPKPAPPPPPKPVLVYDPPHVEKPYKKSVISGTIDTVEYDGNDPTAATNGDDTCPGDHYQPDGTTVSYSNPDDEEETTTRFCGNVMDYFTPGKHLKMVLTDSNVSDYNGCYTLPDVNAAITFGGKPLTKSMVPQHHVEWKMPITD